MQTNKPIFIVGSPRSGTSIVTWCLGQHSNVFVQEESNWLGVFAIQLEIAYRIGTARGERSQLSALDVRREDFFASFGQSINALILDHRQKLEAKIMGRQLGSLAETPGAAPSSAFKITRAASDPKQRWVDGTPEYSFYICPLRKLFPEARFIHIIRDVSSVVRSMLNFQQTGGPRLAANEQQAYEYWLRTVRSCRHAERAYGSEIVRRIRFSDLIDHPKATIATLLEFLSERFEPSCLEPLAERINSSKVPADFDPSDPRTDPAVIDQAKRLEFELEGDVPGLEPDRAIAAELEATFTEQASHISNIEATNKHYRQRAAKLQAELDGLKAGPATKLSSFGRVASWLGLRSRSP